MLLEPLPNRECGPCNVCWMVAAPSTKPVLDPAVAIFVPGGVSSNWTMLGALLCNIYAEVKTEPNERFRHVLSDAAFALKFTVLGNLDEQQTRMLIAIAVPVILAVVAPPGFMGSHRILNPELAVQAACARFSLGQGKQRQPAPPP